MQAPADLRIADVLIDYSPASDPEALHPEAPRPEPAAARDYATQEGEDLAERLEASGMDVPPPPLTLVLLLRLSAR